MSLMKRLLVGVVAAAACLSMAGCTIHSGSTAAVVNGHVIPDSDVTEGIASMQAVVAGDPDNQGIDVPQFIFTLSIFEEIYTQTLDQMGITISDSDRDSYVTSSYGADSIVYTLWNDPDIHNAMRAYIDNDIINEMASSGSLDADQFNAIVPTLTVEVNPKYGTWDPEQMVASALSENTAGGVLANPVSFSMPS